MAVIINELEVLVESSGAGGPRAAAPAAPAAVPPAPSPQDVEDVMDRDLRMRLRTEAH